MKSLSRLFNRVLSSYALYLVLALVIFTAYPIAYKMSSEVIEITVSEKERITTGSGKSIDSKFIIYSDSEVFENTDSWLYFKFNSTDFQNEFTVNQTYKVTVAGWRIPFLSMYRNVVSKNN